MSVYIGNKKLKECYLKNKKIKEIYIGKNKVYSSWPDFYADPDNVKYVYNSYLRKTRAYPINKEITSAKIIGNSIDPNHSTIPCTWMGSFEDCINLERVIITDGIITLDIDAFKNCTSLTKIYISDTVTTFKGGTFTDCSNLEKLILPKSLTKICYNMIYGCKKLKTIEIPKSVTSFEYQAFDNSYIEKLFIPKSVVIIGDGAFAGRELTNIEYEGTINEWNTLVSKSEKWNFQMKTNVIHCSDGDVTI